MAVITVPLQRNPQVAHKRKWQAGLRLNEGKLLYLEVSSWQSLRCVDPHMDDPRWTVYVLILSSSSKACRLNEDTPRICSPSGNLARRAGTLAVSCQRISGRRQGLWWCQRHNFSIATKICRNWRDRDHTGRGWMVTKAADIPSSMAT